MGAQEVKPTVGTGQSQVSNSASVNVELVEHEELVGNPSGICTNPNELKKNTVGGVGGGGGVKPPPIILTPRERFDLELDHGLPSTLPFAQYLAPAIDEFREARTEMEEWQSELFYFVRLVKAHPSMRKLPARQALELVEVTMRLWQSHKLSHRRDESDWEYWLKVSADEAEAEFVGAWDKIRHLPGFSVLASAVALHTACPLGVGKEILGRRPAAYERFISIAGWAQIVVADTDIILPVENLAEELNVSTMTISRFRKWGIEDGFLKETRAWKRGKATRFRFMVGLYPVLAERAGNWSKAEAAVAA